jgi:hypothetical protein
MLTDEQVSKFQELYKNRFGVEISREEAYAQGVKLVRLIEIVYNPNLQKRREETGDN